MKEKILIQYLTKDNTCFLIMFLSYKVYKKNLLRFLLHYFLLSFFFFPIWDEWNENIQSNLLEKYTKNRIASEGWVAFWRNAFTLSDSKRRKKYICQEKMVMRSQNTTFQVLHTKISANVMRSSKRYTKSKKIGFPKCSRNW